MGSISPKHKTIIENNGGCKTMEINIKYHDENMPRIIKIVKGDWLDLCTTEDLILAPNDFTKISLGVSMEIPEGYEVYLVPRGSAFEKYGIIQTNSMGIIDNSFKGDNDIWKMPVYCTKNIYIPKYTRIAQFRITERMPKIILTEVSTLGNPDRGSFGGTGTNEIDDALKEL